MYRQTQLQRRYILKKDNNFLNNYFSELQKLINPEKKINEKN